MIFPFTPSNSEYDVKTPGDASVAKLGNINRLIKLINAAFAAIPGAEVPSFIEFIADGIVSDALRIILNLSSNINSAQHNTPNVLYSAPIYYVPAITYTGDTDVTTLSFPNLTRLTSSIIKSPYITTLSFPSLKEINFFYNGDSTIQVKLFGSNLTTVQMPLLERTDNGAALLFGQYNEDGTGFSPITSLSFPKFTSGNLIIDHNGTGGADYLTNINLPLYHDGTIYISSDVLSTIDLPSIVETEIDIDCSILTTLNLPLLQRITQSKYNTSSSSYISSNSLVTLSIPNLTETIDVSLNVAGNALTTIDLPKLASGQLISSDYGISSVLSLENINLPELVNGSFNFNFLGNSVFTTLDLPKLEIGTVYVSNADSFTTLNLPKLVTGGIDLESCSNFSNLYLPLFGTTVYEPDLSPDCTLGVNGSTEITSLSSVNFPVAKYLNISSNSPDITSVDFPIDVIAAYANLQCINLTHVRLGTIGTIKNCGYQLIFNGQLDAASKTHILEILVSLDGTNGTINWALRTVSNGQILPGYLEMNGGASLSGSDIILKNILVSRGGTVYSN